MALVFPRDLTTGLRWRSPQLKLEHRQELSRQAGGRVQGKDLGPPIWTADFRSVPQRLDDADAAMAQMRSLQGVVSTFYLSPPTRRRPASLSSDAALSGAAVTVNTIRADNAALSLNGLPAGLDLRAGDFLSIETSLQGRAFHQLATGGSANGTGITAELDLVPHLRTDVHLGQAVALLDPMLEMVLVPGSLDDPFDGLAHRAITFRAEQVLR